MAHSAALQERVELEPFPSLYDLEGKGLDRRNSNCETCGHAAMIQGRIVCAYSGRNIDRITGYCWTWAPTFQNSRKHPA